MVVGLALASGDSAAGESKAEPAADWVPASELERLRTEIRQLRCEAHYWRAQHARAAERARRLAEEVTELRRERQQLQAEKERLQAKLKQREQQLFGQRSERQPRTSGEAPCAGGSPSPRSRGARRGGRGHGRRAHDHLPAVEEHYVLPEDQRHCPTCGLPFAAFPGTEDSEQLEIEVRAHRRRIHRHRYRPTCQCPGHAGLITAAGPPKLIPKGVLGLSVWVMILLDKYLYQRPTARLLWSLQTYGLDLSLATVTGGLKQLQPLFEPLYHGLLAQNLQAHQWHADETRWLVLEEIEGKQSRHWYLWLFHSPSTVAYVLHPSRSSAVVEAHFGDDVEGIIIADRYVVYKLLAESGRFLIQFCWAHVRRDFLRVEQGYPEHAAWAQAWVERIRELYRAHARRLATRSSTADRALRSQLARMVRMRDAQLKTGLTEEQAKPLRSLQEHWSGLTVFVDHPQIPMDNNAGERLLRSPVIGRKNYYGSGAIWSGQLAAVLFSLLQTVHLWHLNPRRWLMAYLTACAECGGKAPEHARQFLPWNLTEEQRAAFASETPDTS